MAKVALIQNVMVESLGYMYISAVLKKEGHNVDVFYCDEFNRDKVLSEVEKFQPQIVGFSVLTPSEGFMLALAKEIKKQTSAITIFGNIHVLLNSDILKDDGVDMICRCEGEYVLKELCQRLDEGKDYHEIKGLWIKTSEGIIKNEMPQDLVDVEGLPFHDRALYDKYAFFRHSRYLRVSLGRGCPGSCSFCHNSYLREHYGGSRYLRKQTPKRAIEELNYHLQRRKRVNFIFFTDEVLWLNKEWLREFLMLYKEHIRIPFSANFHFSPIEEEDIRLFKDAGVSSVIFAVETADENQRLGFLNKKVKDKYIFKLAEWLHKYRIRFVSSAMFGLPGDTVSDHINRLDFYKKLNPSYTWTAFFQPYPGLKLTQSNEVQELLQQEGGFASTVHHNMCLKSEEGVRLANLKKVYFLCMRFPWTKVFFLWLTKFRIPLLFDFIFMCHFTYYVLAFEHVSFIQFLIHVKVFGINPILVKIRKSFLPKTT
ncbi:MAG: radical SAM protein [Candidatus Aceula meridiana]|nr:radical SAM protein [Candidatus Aceula meridiana]